jgi:hypothetical protein
VGEGVLVEAGFTVGVKDGAGDSVGSAVIVGLIAAEGVIIAWEAAGPLQLSSATAIKARRTILGDRQGTFGSNNAGSKLFEMVDNSDRPRF